MLGGSAGGCGTRYLTPSNGPQACLNWIGSGYSSATDVRGVLVDELLDEREEYPVLRRVAGTGT
jgi:hypothetical protein